MESPGRRWRRRCPACLAPTSCSRHTLLPAPRKVYPPPRCLIECVEVNFRVDLWEPEEVSIGATSVENLSLVDQLSVPLPSPSTWFLWWLCAVYSWENQHKAMLLLNLGNLQGRHCGHSFGTSQLPSDRQVTLNSSIRLSHLVKKLLQNNKRLLILLKIGVI